MKNLRQYSEGRERRVVDSQQSFRSLTISHPSLRQITNTTMTHGRYQAVGLVPLLGRLQYSHNVINNKDSTNKEMENSHQEGLNASEDQYSDHQADTIISLTDHKVTREHNDTLPALLPTQAGLT
ncbi:hypothetical protein SLE2022_020130 [Rubroshorea leprosula]